MNNQKPQPEKKRFLISITGEDTATIYETRAGKDGAETYARILHPTENFFDITELK